MRAIQSGANVSYAEEADDQSAAGPFDRHDSEKPVAAQAVGIDDRRFVQRKFSDGNR